MSITCGAYYRGKSPCEKSAVVMHLKTFPLCKSHHARFLSEMRVAHAQGQIEASRPLPTLEGARAQGDTQHVYFIKAGLRVKIGYSNHPDMRLKSIRAGHCKAPRGLDTSKAKLLATEIGGRERETELHQQFAHLREAGEWFRRSPDLLSYIDSIAA